jgi:snRNA-activating protein complex subunit 1
MSLADFKRVWMAKKFSSIYEGRPKTNSGVFMQSLFLHCIGRLWFPG